MFWRKGEHRQRRWLSPYLDSSLSDKERRALETHLQACLSCRQELQELQATVEALRSLSLAEAPRSFALRPEQMGPLPRRRPALGGLVIPMRLAAASLALALAALVLVDVGDFGGGQVALPQGTPAPAAEGAPEPSQPEDRGQATFQQSEATPTPDDAAAQEGRPSESEEGGGLDPLRAAEIGLGAGLGALLLAFLVVSPRIGRFS